MEALLLLNNTADAVNGCSAFYDMDVDIWDFSRYHEYFNQQSTYTLAGAGVYGGVDGIKEYVKLAATEGLFVDKHGATQGTLVFKGVNTYGQCVFTGFSTSIFHYSPTYTAGDILQQSTMTAFLFCPASKKIDAIVRQYDNAFYQHVFQAARTRPTAEFFCSTMQDKCPQVWEHNKLTGQDQCINKFMDLPLFDDGPQLDQSQGGGFDGNSSGCRMIHVGLAAENADHCAHISFVPMRDNLGRVKCQVSKRLRPDQFFDEANFLNFRQFKKAVGLSETEGFKVLEDVCLPPLPVLPRPYWDDWNRSATDVLGFLVKDGIVAAPLEYMDDDAFSWFFTAVIWLSVLMVGLGSEYILGDYMVVVTNKETMRRFWRAAQVTFPLFLSVALGSQSVFGLPFLTVGLWKFGCPETLTNFRMMQNQDFSNIQRAVFLLNGVSLLLHHGATSWLIVCVATHRERLDRNLLSCTLPLIVQHWFAILKYWSRNLYVSLSLAVEVVWEWEVLFNVLVYSCHSHNIKVVAWVMLVAHWGYMLSGGYGLLKQWGYVQRFSARVRMKSPSKAETMRGSLMVRLRKLERQSSTEAFRQNSGAGSPDRHHSIQGNPSRPKPARRFTRGTIRANFARDSSITRMRNASPAGPISADSTEITEDLQSHDNRALVAEDQV